MDTFFPAVMITYLAPFRQAFSQPGWPYFNGFIWALLVVEGRKCVTRLGRACFFLDRSLSSWERFLAEAQWDLPQVTATLIRLLRQEMGDALVYAGHYILALDTTYVAKVRGRMLGVQRWTEHSANPDRGEQVTGHQWALGGLLAWLGDRWQCFPVVARWVSGQQHPSHVVVTPEGHAHLMTFWEAVEAVVFQLAQGVTGTPVCVVVDAYFAKACFLNPMRERAIGVVTRLRHDAVGWDDPVYCGRGRRPNRGRHWKLADLWHQGARQTITAHVYGKSTDLVVVVRDIWLRDVAQKVRVVVLAGELRPILLACTELTWSAQQIVEVYAARFSLELTIRDLKGHFGFGNYQATTSGAILRFGQLCCVAWCVGRLLLRPQAASTWLMERPSAPVTETTESFAKLRRGLRRFVLTRVLFAKSAADADFEKLQQEFEPLFRLVA